MLKVINLSRYKINLLSIVFFFLIFSFLFSIKVSAVAPAGCTQLWSGTSSGKTVSFPYSAEGYYLYYQSSAVKIWSVQQPIGTQKSLWQTSGKGFGTSYLIQNSIALNAGNVYFDCGSYTYLYEIGACGANYTAGSLINSLTWPINAYLTSNWSTDLSSVKQIGTQNVGLVNNSRRIASFDVNFDYGNLSWGNVVADVDWNNNKSYFGYSSGDFANIPGKASSTYTLYVLKSATGQRVGLCPNANSLADVNSSCEGMRYVVLGSGQVVGSDTLSVTSVTEGSINYWKIAGLSVKMGGFDSTGNRIINLGSLLKAYSGYDWSTNFSTNYQTGTTRTGIGKGLVKIASFDVNFEGGNVDWTNLYADSGNNLSYLNYVGGNFTDIPGLASSDYTLYVPKTSKAMRVGFCPFDIYAGNVGTSCPGLTYIYNNGGNGVYTTGTVGGSTVTVTSGSDAFAGYWVVSGLTVKTGAFSSEGYVVQPNTVPNNTTIILAAAPDTNVADTGTTGVQNVAIKSSTDNTVIANIPVDFTKDLSFSNLTTGKSSTKAFVHVPGGIDALPGVPAGETYTLYVAKGDGDKVWICPGANSLDAVSLSCSGGYYLTEGQTFNGATASVVIEDGKEYWKIDGLTGTGGMSVVTGLRDTLTRLQSGVGANHYITIGTNYGLAVGTGYSMVLNFADFNISNLTISDIELTDNVGLVRNLATTPGVNTWGVVINSINKTITFTVPTSGTGGFGPASQIEIKIGTNVSGGVNQIINPSNTGNYNIYITLNNTNPGEEGTVSIPIVDNDRVDITGYVSAYMHFDIDTGVGEIPGVDPIINCEFNTCRIYENGQPGLSNYTVDLGELTSAVVNKSNSTSVAHSDGGNGKINSIYFDISTNAASGAVVTVKSLNGGLQGPGSNKIPSIGISTGADGITRADGEDIPANSGVYGYTLPVASSQLHGSIVPNSLCDSAVKYCGAGTTPKTVFTTNNLPVDTARVRLDLAAAANYTNNPGSYTDTLTFMATATF